VIREGRDVRVVLRERPRLVWGSYLRLIGSYLRLIYCVYLRLIDCVFKAHRLCDRSPEKLE